ncbi:MetQ/NlpA family ABC transporter substrate-binding protein [Ammoniphilus sp. 3BR4]|uniref:MetQ/NlpA family ABC transporter substrate-binding protein n=1 Tax=Ammoniphilus sp. 3BR4 TaxID=3158265 RepID=UPI0034662DD1
MKKWYQLLTASILAIGILGGCASQEPANDKANNEGAAGEKTEKVVLNVGASSVPHAEILNAAKPLLEEKGIELNIKEFNDYILPNKVLEEKELDANYFQHLPYLQSFNEEHKTHLASAFAVHFEPLGLYPGKQKSLDNIAKGSIIAVPNDPTNEARALHLLQAKGLITLPEGADLTITPKDIVENPNELVIKELDAAFIARSLGDVDYAVINGNYALEAGLKATDALALEDKESLAAETFANIVAVREGDETKEPILALKDALNSPEVKKFIEEKYQGSVIAVFE